MSIIIFVTVLYTTEVCSCLADNSMSLMCVPSAALQALVPSVDSAVMMDSPADANNEVPEMNVFNRPSMAFIIEAHNLSDLKWAMKQAVRKAACRSYALQVSEKQKNNNNLVYTFCFMICV